MDNSQSYMDRRRLHSGKEYRDNLEDTALYGFRKNAKQLSASQSNLTDKGLYNQQTIEYLLKPKEMAQKINTQALVKPSKGGESNEHDNILEDSAKQDGLYADGNGVNVNEMATEIMPQMLWAMFKQLATSMETVKTELAQICKTQTTVDQLVTKQKTHEQKITTLERTVSDTAMKVSIMEGKMVGYQTTVLEAKAKYDVIRNLVQ